MEKDKCDKCESCGEKVEEGLHPCPYVQDINGDDDDVCNCCAECENQCAEDI